jgi:hypothetical protein
MNQKDRLIAIAEEWQEEWRRADLAASTLAKYIEKLHAELTGLRGLLHDLADAYGDEEKVEIFVYEIYCEFGGGEE